MKLKGQKLESKNEEIIVIPRGNDDDIVLKAGAVQNLEDFEQLYPEPKVKFKLVKGGQKVPDLGHEIYVKQIEEREKARMSYFVIQSLKATEDLEWETIDENDPSTWDNYTDELKESGFSSMEINRIIMGVMDANCLNEGRIQEARERFLSGLEEPVAE